MLQLLGEEATSPGDRPACFTEQQRWEHAALHAACRAAQVAVRAAEGESRAILQSRQRQEQSTALVMPHFDTARAQVQLPAAAGGSLQQLSCSDCFSCAPARTLIVGN